MFGIRRALSAWGAVLEPGKLGSVQSDLHLLNRGTPRTGKQQNPQIHPAGERAYGNNWGLLSSDPGGWVLNAVYRRNQWLVPSTVAHASFNAWSVILAVFVFERVCFG